MGLWIEVIGVRGGVPTAVAVDAEDDFALAWVAESGWTWATLEDDWERDLAEAAVSAAELASAPVLAFLIADSDLAVLYGAAPGEPSVVASTGEYEEPGPKTQAREFAAWTERHAPRAVARERFEEWARTNYVFADEALSSLLAQMGLVETPAEPPETLDG